MSCTASAFGWKRTCRLVLLAAGMLFVLRLPAQVAPEYDRKAGALFNFIRFVTWPESSFEKPDSPLVIGVLGTDPFGEILDALVKGESYQSHPIIVERYEKLRDLKPCHLLFVSSSESRNLSQVFRALKGKSVLTVGDSRDFIERGGMIELVTSPRKILLRVNERAARDERLQLSSKLLRVADEVVKAP